MTTSKASLPLPSDDTIPSTPLASDEPIFSDDAPNRASSPPSSPPGFPWENENESLHQSPSKPTKPAISAFSVLGKRKALSQLNDNARAPKKVAFAASAKNEDRPLTQMQISLGQEVQKKCKECGMEYIASSAEDRKLHDKYHKQNAEGYDVGKDFLGKSREGTVFDAPTAGDAMVMVDGSDSIWRRRRAKAALDVVQRELGAVEIPEEQLWNDKARHTTDATQAKRYRVYMYIRGTKCVGVLLAERIVSAHAVVEPPSTPKDELPVASSKVKKLSSLAALRARRASAEKEDQVARPIQLSAKGSPAALGISRIWTSPKHRGQGIANTLLDLALAQHPIPDCSSSDKGEGAGQGLVAFSQPTDAGAKLARRWFGKRFGWLVYVD